MSKILSFEAERQWLDSSFYDSHFEYFRGGKYGCMMLYRDKKTNRGYWLKDDLFMSAPLLKYGTPDLDNVDFLSNLEEKGGIEINFSKLIKILEELVRQNVINDLFFKYQEVKND